MTSITQAEKDSQVATRLNRLVDELRAAAGSNLRAVALYGGLAKGRYTPGISDVNVLVVVEEAGLSALLALAPTLTAALRDSRVVPFVVTPADLVQAARLFPVKLLDIRASHSALYGDPGLASLEIDAAALRERLLQEIKNLELRLRLRIVEQGGAPAAIWRHLLGSLPKLAVTLEGVLRERGRAVPPDRPGVLRAAVQELGLGPEAVAPFAPLRRSDPQPSDPEVRRLAAGYLELLGRIGIALASPARP